jgi:hypothetical protein
MRYDKRVDSLEVRLLATKQASWAFRVAAEDAFAKVVREKLARRLAGEPDTPEQVARYAAVYAQWKAVQGPDKGDPGARERVMARIEDMAARIRFHDEHDGGAR